MMLLKNISRKPRFPKFWNFNPSLSTYLRNVSYKSCLISLKLTQKIVPELTSNKISRALWDYSVQKSIKSEVKKGFSSID
jgi:hypothetical protein